MVRVKKAGVIVHEETKTFTSEKLARHWGERVEAGIKKGGISERKLDGVTIASLLYQFGASLEENNAIRRQRTHEVAQLASDPIGQLKLSEMQAHSFTAFATRRCREGAGPATRPGTT